jgi:hypothetical protein
LLGSVRRSIVVWAPEKSKPRSKMELQQTMALSLTRQRLKTEMLRSTLSAALLDPNRCEDHLVAYIQRALRDIEDD